MENYYKPRNPDTAILKTCLYKQNLERVYHSQSPVTKNIEGCTWKGSIRYKKQM